MSLFRPAERRGLPTSIDPNQLTARPIFGNYSGEIVDEFTAFTSSAVAAAVTLLGDSIGTMPLDSYRDRSGRWEKLPRPTVFVRPNSDQLMFEFIQQTVITMALHGTAFWWCPRQGLYPLELRNIHPSKVIVKTEPDGTRLYKVGREVFGSDTIQQINWVILPDQARSMSPIDVLRNIVGTDIAINRFLSAWYGDGGTPGSVLETDSIVSLCKAPVLAIDDIGREKSSEWTKQTLYTVIESRYSNAMPTLIATNEPPVAWDSKFGEAVASRMHEMCEVLYILGEDRRRIGN